MSVFEVGGAHEPRGALRLLLDGSIGPFVLARMISSIGIWMHNVAAAIVVYQLSGSVTMVALVSVAQFGPQLVLAPLGGMLADRWSRVVQSTIGRLLASAGAGLLALTILISPPGTLRPWHVIAAALVVGVGFAISTPANQSLVPALGRPGELATIVSLDTIPATIARAAGPAIAGVLLVSGGAAVTFAVAAGSQMFLAVTVLFIRFNPVIFTPSTDRGILGGIRYLRVDPVLATMLLGVVGIGLGIDPAVTLAPALADEFGAGTETAVVLTVAFGSGAILALCLLGLIRRRWPIMLNGTVGAAALAGSLALVSISPWPGAAVLWLCIGGAGMFLGITGYTAAIQARLPENLRGRVMALWSIAFLGSRPLSAAIDGLVADAISVHAAFAVMAALLSAIGAASMLHRRAQTRRRAN